MHCGWESNRRSGVVLAMRHRLQWFIHLWAHDLRKRDEHPTYTFLMGYDTLYLTLPYRCCLLLHTSYVPLSLGLSVRWVQRRALPKRPNRLRCHFGRILQENIRKSYVKIKKNLPPQLSCLKINLRRTDEKVTKR